MLSTIYFLCLFLTAHVQANSYESQRENLINEELSDSLGGRLLLTTEETLANEILMQKKFHEIDQSYKYPELYNFSRHYFEYKDHIEDSEVYQIIKKMPKGAVLHLHSSAMMDADYLVNLTYHDHLYACFSEGGSLQFRFSADEPNKPCAGKWKLMSDLRNSLSDVTAFDNELKQYLRINANTEDDINAVWNEFSRALSVTKSLILYKPICERFFYDALKKFYDDKILYIEIRTSIHQLYDLDGTVYERIELPRLYRKVTEKFKQDYPDFIGVRMIVTIQRKSPLSIVKTALDLALEVKEEMPDFVAGFDLVGQESLGKELKHFFPVLLPMKGKIDFYFHSGETNWYGTPADENLIDALLLGTKRIGHGYAVLKHPKIMEIIRSKNIPLEVNVVSNIVLSLIKDVRNHPLSVYLAYDLPVALSCDDPGIWGAEPLSHDFFIAFMGIASRKADLRTLKQLALNSIEYSSLDAETKKRAYEVFYKQWESFIHELISSAT